LRRGKVSGASNVRQSGTLWKGSYVGALPRKSERGDGMGRPLSSQTRGVGDPINGTLPLSGLRVGGGSPGCLVDPLLRKGIVPPRLRVSAPIAKETENATEKVSAPHEGGENAKKIPHGAAAPTRGGNQDQRGRDRTWKGGNEVRAAGGLSLVGKKKRQLKTIENEGPHDAHHPKPIGRKNRELLKGFDVPRPLHARTLDRGSCKFPCTSLPSSVDVEIFTKPPLRQDKRFLTIPDSSTSLHHDRADGKTRMNTLLFLHSPSRVTMYGVKRGKVGPYSNLTTTTRA